MSYLSPGSAVAMVPGYHVTSPWNLASTLSRALNDCCFLGAGAAGAAGTATGGATAVDGAPGGSGGGAVVASISRWACSACSSDVLNPKLIMPPELPKLPPVWEGKAAASPGGGHAQI